MRPLSAKELLQVWEWGENQNPLNRSLTLLAAACPDMSPEDLAKLSIGQRDALLLTLREWTFGSQLVSLANCLACGDRLELNFNVADIRTSASAPPEVLELSQDGYRVQFRLPNSLDLAEIAVNKAATARLTLLERCLLAVHYQDEEQPTNQLPPAIIDAVAEQMAQADPQAEVKLSLSCPSCHHQWQPVFDIVSFFWIEIKAWVRRILREVHLLASAYGWREADILAMSARRRQLYLEMLER